MQKLCGLTLDALLEAADRQSRELAFLPRWEARQLDLTAAYNQRMREAGKKGYGMFAKHHVFTVENGQLVPVKYPDPQKLSELPGYEKEREKVIANTRALLAGSPPTMSCSTAMPAPANPARSRPLPMSTPPTACGWWRSRRTSSTRSPT